MYICHCQFFGNDNLLLHRIHGPPGFYSGPSLSGGTGKSCSDKPGTGKTGERPNVGFDRVNHRLKDEIKAHQRSEKQKEELESHLQRAQKMESLGTLAGGVAHDLNNILSGVVSYPDLLLIDMPEESPFRDALLLIKNSGEKAAAIVQDLLTLARRGRYDFSGGQSEHHHRRLLQESGIS